VFQNKLNMKKFRLLTGIISLSCLTSISEIQAQCPGGQLEVSLQVVTDSYGYEGYWEITEGNGTCGTNTIASGGNSEVGCISAEQIQAPGGYGNNLLITEGPWCFDEGSTYTLHYRDDWGDGGFTFRVLVGGAIVSEISGAGLGGDYQFQVVAPPALNAALFSRINSTDIMGPYYEAGEVVLKAVARNLGSESVQSLSLAYSVNGSAPVEQQINGITANNYENFRVAFPQPWVINETGSYQVKIWIAGINGQADMVPENDTIALNIKIGPAQPDIISDYQGTTPIFNTIGNSAQNIAQPTDLDFHPDASLRQLWVINKSTANSGGTTVILNQAGEAQQNHLFRQDGNAWHFMSLPTGIAFGENGNFATSPGVFDANHQSTSVAFTGPTLWSGDLEIFAQPSGGNGSHLDMLHESPYSQGVAWEVDNVYWIFDGYNRDLVRYDFAEDHDPGNSWHGDAIIRRYSDDELNRDQAGVVPSHLILDDNKQWLYAVDNGNNRVIRIDITTGQPSGIPPSYGPHEDVVEYSTYTGYTQQTVVGSGLQKPAGIALKNNRLLVSDYATGKIHVYDISSIPATELFQIQTPAAGIMGIVLDPDGRIVYVDHNNSEVVLISPGVLLIDQVQSDFSVFPNPANNQLFIRGDLSKISSIRMCDLSGRSLAQPALSADGRIDVSHLAQGIYFLNLVDAQTQQVSTLKWVKH
jgi:hypothetical protein